MQSKFNQFCCKRLGYAFLSGMLLVMPSILDAATPAYLTYPMSSLDLSRINKAWGYQSHSQARANRTNDDKPIVLNHVSYASGVGMHSVANFPIQLDGKVSSFSAILGVGDETGKKGSIQIEAWVDGTRVYQSPVLRGFDHLGKKSVATISLNLTGKSLLTFRILDADGSISYDHAVFANATFFYPAVLGMPPKTASWMPLTNLNLENFNQDWGDAQKNRNVESGLPLKVKGVEYSDGIGSHSTAELGVQLNGQASSFETEVGIDDAGTDGTIRGTAVFKLLVDGVVKVTSGLMQNGDTPKKLTVPLIGANVLKLVVEDGGDGYRFDHANWLNPRLTMSPQATAPPFTIPMSTELPIIAKTKLDGAPQFHGPKILGGTPGKNFIFRVPVTGQGPLTMNVSSLPPGLSFTWLGNFGLIAGTLPVTSGHYSFGVTVHNSQGSRNRIYTLSVGPGKLALTPLMGWSSWNVFGLNITETKIMAQAAAMSEWLAPFGYQYLNIDDGWEGTRTNTGAITSNSNFPSMSNLGMSLHLRGLKFGIYSSPGEKTCGNFVGSLGHEAQDVQTFASWGVDFLKYDWCSYENTFKSLTGVDGKTVDGQNSPHFQAAKAPYDLMGNLLSSASRDIVFSLCQYGMAKVWEWGATVKSQAWRVAGDIIDTWSSLRAIVDGNANTAPFGGISRWNDLDMLVLGKVGWNGPLRQTRLTPHEQQLHMSFWALFSSPLMIGGDMTGMNPTTDPFTYNLLTNSEVIAINQDSLGKPAKLVQKNGGLQVWSKVLDDGSIAVGFFNLTREKSTLVFPLSTLLFNKSVAVRDVWNKQDLGQKYPLLSAVMEPHSTRLFKIKP